jgi:aminoglycoside phosphotransferase (APT) family kinase protein
MENIARTLENEYTIVRLLSDKGLPVPRPLWLEMNESLPRRRFRGSGPSAR